MDFDVHYTDEQQNRPGWYIYDGYGGTGTLRADRLD